MKKTRESTFLRGVNKAYMARVAENRALLTAELKIIDILSSEGFSTDRPCTSFLRKALAEKVSLDG